MPHEKFYQAFLDNNPYPRFLKDTRPDFDSPASVHVYRGDQRLINFSANDYLGLARHPLLIARSHEYTARWGTGVTSSRLVSGNYSLFTELEEKLAQAIGKPAALIMSAGYLTNSTVLETLFSAEILPQKPLIFSDRAVHVSMLGATQHGTLRRFRHNDLTHLQTLLEQYTTSSCPKFILVESVYSMDGDQAELAGIIALAKTHKAFLYVDDAHALGVYGKSGWGKGSLFANDISMVMGTFSKGLGSFGGFIACSVTLKDFLVNKCRGLIYSTGLSPATLGAIAGAIEILPQLDDARATLLRHAEHVRKFFHAQQLDYGKSDTHIIPWIIGDPDETVRLSLLLEKEGILATAIRPPTVAAGKSRIRFCLSSAHSTADIDALLAAIAKILPVRG
jgi:8-amino-7-oxononanoate synthase